MGPSYAQTRCFDRVFEMRELFSIFFFHGEWSHSVACMEMGRCAVTHVCASTSVSFLFLEQRLK